MKKILLLITLYYSGTLYSQEINIVIKETPPYKVSQAINVEIILTNTTVDTITYFDSRGPSWGSFKEAWEMNENSQYVEVLPLNGAHDQNFCDSTIMRLPPGEKMLIRSHTINLASIGYYSLTYTQEQSPEFVQKKYADTTVTDSLIQSITVFQVSNNIKFEVFDNFDTTVKEIINMTWEEWKEYRYVKLYSRKNHFLNLNAAFLYPQDVYSLSVFCNGLDAETIKRIGGLKNLKALTLRNYEVNYFPKELAELDLYELTIIPSDGVEVDYSEGLSKNNTIRELTTKYFNGIPEQLLSLNELIYLDINDCPIKTLPKLDSLTNLQVFSANNCELSSINDIGLDKLLKLKDLTLSGNKELDDFTPLLTCTNLEFLVLNRTSIDSIPDEIENLKKLKKLSLSNALIMVSDSIGNLEDMRYLSFGGNRKLSYFPASILKMKKLLHLDISNTKIEELPEGISELPLEKVLIYNTNCAVTKDYKVLKNRLKEEFRD